MLGEEARLIRMIVKQQDPGERQALLEVLFALRRGFKLPMPSEIWVP